MTGDELPDLPALRVLEPPPGGIALLRARLDDTPRAAWRWWRFAIPALAIAAVIAFLVVRRDRVDPPAPSPAPTALADPAIEHLYWVASTPGPRAKPPSNVISITEAPKVETITLGD